MCDMVTAGKILFQVYSGSSKVRDYRCKIANTREGAL